MGPDGEGETVFESGDTDIGHRRSEAVRVDLERRTLAVFRHSSSIGVRVIRSAAKDRVTTSAASLAFHWFLAVFPGALALLGLAHIVGLTPTQVRGLVHDLDVVLPAAASGVLTEALRSPVSHNANFLELIAGTVVALWASVESMAALQVGLDIANNVQRDRGLVKRRLVALPLLGLTVLLGGSAFALLVLGAPLGRLLSISVPDAGPVIAIVWNIARFAGAFVLISILMSAYYAIGPWKQHPKWRWVTPGSLTATLGWLVTSWAYSLYLDDVGHESRSYGTFAGVAALLLWLFVTAVAVLLGAELDRDLETSSRREQSVDRGD